MVGWQKIHDEISVLWAAGVREDGTVGARRVLVGDEHVEATAGVPGRAGR